MDTESKDDVRSLVEEVLRAGLMFTDVLGEILEDLPEDAFPGEDTGAVLIEMLTGSMRPVAEAAGSASVRQTTALLGAMGDRFVADLLAARDLSAARGQE